MLEENHFTRYNKLIYWVVNILMVLVFLDDAIYNMSIQPGSPIRVGLMRAITIALTIIVFFYSIPLLKERAKGVIWIFTIYSLFSFYYIFIDRQVPRELMLGVKAENTALFRDYLILTMQVASAPLILKKFDPSFFSKCVILVLASYWPYYITHTNLSLYIMAGAREYAANMHMQELMTEERYIGAFQFSRLACLGILCTLYVCKNFNLKNKWYLALGVYSFLINLYCVFIASKRGPLLMLFVTLVTFLYYRAMVSRRNMTYIIIIGFVLLFSSEFLITYLYQADFAYGLMSRIVQVTEDGGSHRFGEEDTEFVQAFMQLIKNPFTGTYFRITNEFSWTYGSYPHNFFLETIMTFGILFSIPFYKMIWKQIKKCINNIKINDEMLLLSLMFIYFFLCLMTSGSIFCSEIFWIPLALLYVSPNKNVLINEK